MKRWCGTLGGIIGQLLDRIVHTWADDAAAFNRVLQQQDPSWGSERHELAGGWLVLDGAGMCVNRALAAGIEPCLHAADLTVLIERAGAVGVAPMVEVSDVTAPASLDVLRAHGFAPDADATTGFVWPSGCPLPDPPPNIAIRSISAATVPEWQGVSALGWGHTTSAARRAADAFARAAFEIDGDGMVIAYDAGNGRPVGCASLTRRDGVASLGGMSTIPAERRRGVQAALVRHRIDVALDSGCDVVTVTASTGGASERNLTRLGFEPVITLHTYAGPSVSSAVSSRELVVDRVGVPSLPDRRRASA